MAYEHFLFLSCKVTFFSKMYQDKIISTDQQYNFVQAPYFFNSKTVKF